MNLDSTAGIAARLSRFRQLATGSPSPSFPAEEVAESATFAEVVTLLFKWFGEQMRDDIRFLTSVADGPERVVVEKFARLLTSQRHLDQHADYSNAAEARAWRAEAAPASEGSFDAGLSQALLAELNTALETLCSIAARIGRDEKKRRTWTALAAASPAEEMRAVFANMGRRPHPRTLDYAVRQFRSHPGLRNAMTPQDRAQVAELVAIGASLTPLSVAYDEILDEFGFIGNPIAYALLILAHGVQAAGVGGSRLIPVLRGVWQAVDSPAL